MDPVIRIEPVAGEEQPAAETEIVFVPIGKPLTVNGLVVQF